MTKKSFKDELKKARGEKDVENAYRAELSNNLKDATINSPFGCDGLLQAPPNIRTLLEFKYKEEMKNKLVQCGVLIQILYYLKKFENAGEKLPSTIFVGDRKECFALRVSNVAKYLKHDIDWDIAPSSANKKNIKLLRAMVDDVDILPFVHDIDDQFSIRTVIEKIKQLSDNVITKVRVSDKNIGNIFDYFNTNVLEKGTKLTTNERANLFIQIIVNTADNCLHPKKRNVLITKGFGEIPINRGLFLSFFAHFEGETYSPVEKEQFTALVDRLVEDTVRRRKGEFFTPTLFVAEAHKYIAKAFGADWREKYIVWDCCAGTGNLTRDYNFKELYMSTVEPSDIDTIEQMGYNPDAVKFQYDFLNDGVGDEIDMFDESSMPEGLSDAISSGKKILFLINPPYMKATPNKGNDGTGVAATGVASWMTDRGMGIAASQLSAQFLFRILRIKELNPNIELALFNKPNYMTSDGFSDLREYLLNEFDFRGGFLFNASHFADASSKWGISFSLWGSKGKKAVSKNSFEHTLVDVEDFQIVVRGKKTLYNCDGQTKANVIFGKVKNTVVMPPIKSYVTIDDAKEKKGCKDAIGYMNNHANNQMQQQVVFLASSVIGANGNQAILPENFYDATALFAARRAVPQDWINDKDEYLAPDQKNPAFEQFKKDSVVYALFNNSSQQSGMRKVKFMGKKYDIRNEFFWGSRDLMMKWANKENYDGLYKDAKAGEERFVSRELTDGLYDALSPDARAVLDAANALLKKSISMRKLMSENSPEFHLDSFDAGYAQLKHVWKEYFKDEYLALRELYKEFEMRMRCLVFELGYLKE